MTDTPNAIACGRIVLATSRPPTILSSVSATIPGVRPFETYAW
jgi:hypothetical protein